MKTPIKKLMGLLLDELFEARHHLLSLRHVVSADEGPYLSNP